MNTKRENDDDLYLSPAEAAAFEAAMDYESGFDLGDEDRKPVDEQEVVAAVLAALVLRKFRLKIG